MQFCFARYTQYMYCIFGGRKPPSAVFFFSSPRQSRVWFTAQMKVIEMPPEHSSPHVIPRTREFSFTVPSSMTVHKDQRWPMFSLRAMEEPQNHLIWSCQGNCRKDSKFSTSIAVLIFYVDSFEWPTDDFVSMQLVLARKKGFPLLV